MAKGYTARCSTSIAFAALLGLALPANATAGSATGKIKALVVRASDGLQYVILDTAPVNRPACANYPYFIIRDEKSDTGKAQFAMLMTAYLANKTVAINGSGACARWFDGEDIDIIQYQPS